MSQVLDKFSFDVLSEYMSLVINAQFMEDRILLNTLDNFESTITSDKVRFYIDL